MSKSGRSKRKPAPKAKNKRLLQVVLAIVVVAGLISSWFLISGGPPEQNRESVVPAGVPQEALPASLKNRMVLPAQPRKPRPSVMDASGNPDPEIRAAYAAARDVPEVLEHIACYCGCFMNAGHRNNLDCFKDAHGLECSLCRAIAIEAQRQAKMGTPVAQIKRSIDERWAPPIH